MLHSRCVASESNRLMCRIGDVADRSHTQSPSDTADQRQGFQIAIEIMGLTSSRQAVSGQPEV